MMMRRRRRPVLRTAAMVGGGAALYHAGKKTQAGADHEQEQDAAIDQMAEAPAPPPPPAPVAAPAASGISEDAIAKLKELGQLHDQGVLTDEEFAAQKTRSWAEPRPRQEMKCTMDEFGPVQILVVGFDGTTFKGEILPELQRLKEQGIIRLVDMVAVAKDQDGEIFGVELSDLSQDSARSSARSPGP